MLQESILDIHVYFAKISWEHGTLGKFLLSF